MTLNGLNYGPYGPRPDYRNMENIPKDVAQKYRNQMNKLLQESKGSNKKKIST